MNNDGANIKNPKERGEWAELRFMARAAEQGFRVSKPWGDSARYDYTLEIGDRFVRVQVKSTIYRYRGAYQCMFDRSRGQRYTAEEVDFFAVFVIPEDVWYILPAELATSGSGHVVLDPGREGQKYEAYKEAWHLMREGEGGHKEESEAEPVVVAPDAEAESIAEMRGAIEAAPKVGFDRDLLRRRMGACFDFVDGEKK
ncbi:MAG: hypothetical protein LAO03_22705 [Acidobacteriia bacterium]|nr:hypothetical protein [Terriglobia bacterium]